MPSWWPAAVLVILLLLRTASGGPDDYGARLAAVGVVQQDTLCCETPAAPLCCPPAACPTATCNASPQCQCASTAPPGGLDPAKAVQFLVLTNDDAGAWWTGRSGRLGAARERGTMGVF